MTNIVSFTSYRAKRCFAEQPHYDERAMTLAITAMMLATALQVNLMAQYFDSIGMIGVRDRLIDRVAELQAIALRLREDLG